MQYCQYYDVANTYKATEAVSLNQQGGLLVL